MTAILDFLFRDHDAGLVLLSLAVCMLSAYSCMLLARHAHRQRGQRRLVWIAGAGGAVGFGIWTTHFVAMQGYHAGFHIGYDIGLTALSLVIAIALSIAGIAMAVTGKTRGDKVLGGAIVGIGISLMHFTGIASMVMGGSPIWSPGAVVTSIGAGIVLGGASFALGLGGGRLQVLIGAALMTAAVGAMHFTAMAALDLSMCFQIIAQTTGAEFTVSLASSVFGLGLLVTALAVMRVERHEARRREQEIVRRRVERQRLSEASKRLQLAIESLGQGIGVYASDGTLIVHNKRLPAMLGLTAQHDLTGLTMREIVRETVIRSGATDPAIIEREADRFSEPHRTLLAQPGGGEITHTIGDRTIRASYTPAGDGTVVIAIDDITDRLLSEQKITYLSRHDSLTGLANRAEYFGAVEIGILQAGRTGKVLAAIALDIDNLSDINDRFGTAGGDQVIIAIGERLKAFADSGDAVARTGGDEFGALKVMESVHGLEVWIADIYRAIAGPLTVANSTINPSARIGISIFPQDGEDAAKLIANAEMALARARQDQPGTICLYEPAFDEEARRRRDLVIDIKSALDNNQFTVAYQVQKSVSAGRVVGYEALVRWTHPARGPIAPSVFIPVAEQAGLIIPLGYRVLEIACEEALAAGLEGRLSVNLSPLQLADARLYDQVAAILQRTGYPAGRLCFEVTESAIVANKDAALAVLRQFKLLGISIAIDDFGTGYSSLDTLRSFPFDKIKLDRSFVAEIEDDGQSQAIMRAVIGLGRALDMPVLAEGVETERQLAVLRRESCSEVQGYLLGRPMPISAYQPKRAAG